MSLLSLSLDAVERGWVPDAITRAAIRQLCAQRLRGCDRGQKITNSGTISALVESMRSGPIAPVPEKANEQHYELPPEFFAAVLGPHRKYSSCFWPTAEILLAEAEAASLAITCERADLADGQTILELGCGWGSLSLWIAERFRNSRIVAISNSASQRRFIETEAASRRLTNLQIITADMNQFVAEPSHFDRIVSVEMFEHMRNYEQLLEQVASWLKPDGKLFVHHFCHRQFAYPFETEGDANWMGRYFFTGGLMPSENMLRQFGNGVGPAPIINGPPKPGSRIWMLTAQRSCRFWKQPTAATQLDVGFTAGVCSFSRWRNSSATPAGVNGSCHILCYSRPVRNHDALDDAAAEFAAACDGHDDLFVVAEPHTSRCQRRRSVLGNRFRPRDVVCTGIDSPGTSVRAIVVARHVDDSLGFAAVAVPAVAQLGPP